MKSLALVIAILSASIAAAHPSGSADIESQFADLRARIDALELENKSLRQTLPPSIAEPAGPYLTAESEAAEKPTQSELEPQLDDLESELAKATAECPPHRDNSDDLTMTGSWNHGLEFKSKNTAFRVHVGGRSQFDSSWYSADENVDDNINRPYENGVDLRRARLRIDGTMYHTMDWAVEYDFVNSFEVDVRAHTVTAPTDLWWTFRELPCVGNLRIGNQKPAIGFEHLVSSRFLPFMERSYNQDAFYGGLYNGFVPGVSIFDNWGDEDLGTWNVGFFKPTDNVFASGANDGDRMAVARLTRLCWYDCDGASLLHLGGSILAQTPARDRITFRTRDAIRAGLSADWPVPANTGTISGDSAQFLNGELVAVGGPWTFQSEYLVANLDEAAPIILNVVQPSVGNVVYHGGYAQVLVFLTGEHDNYNKSTGVFDRVIPHRNFYFRHYCVESGPAAWQVGVRYNFLDLNDKTLDGGILHNVTGGLNWFLNPNMKLQFDYFTTHRDAPLAGTLGDGWIHGFGIRVAHDF